MALIDYSWSRVAHTRPRLHDHVRVERVRYRDEPWYLLHDESSGRSHRFPPAVYRMICLLDGRHDLQQIHDALQQGEEPPEREQLFRVYNQLRAAELLRGDADSDLALLEHQRRHWEGMRRKQHFGSPLALRFSLWDPDRLLLALLPWIRPMLSRIGLVAWLGLLVWALLLVGRHWSELTHNIADAALAPDNLVILFLVYPLVKFLHEMGHALMTRRHGGEVHEMGIMLLVFMPVPYVEASSATAFPQRRARIAVSGAGIMVELLLAALAMIVWSQVEPGLVRSIAFNVMLIGGVSTLLFNGNPLLRFDGYYLLGDAIEMPNLAPRANRYLGYLVQRHLFGVRGLEPPATTRSEAAWLLGYGVASFCYRLFISAVIILFVAGKFFFVGVIIAFWAVYALLVKPLIRGLRFVFASQTLAHQRPRAVSLTLALMTLTAGLLFQWPVAVWSNAQGVIWLPPEAYVRTTTAGFCREILVRPGNRVEAGQPILRLEDDELATAYRVLQAKRKELDLQYQAIWRSDRTAAKLLRKKIDAVEADLERHAQRLAGLELHAGHEGVIQLPDFGTLEGRYLEQGELVAYVLQPPLERIRTSVEQRNISLLRSGIEQVEVRLAERPETVYQARVARQVPAASNQLPSPVLGKPAGGPIPVDPSDPGGRRAYESVFHFDLILPPEAQVSGVGGRAYIRFHHRPEPLAVQWYRSLRQLLLRRFAI